MTRPTPEQRFMSMVDTTSGPDGCWPFTGYIDKGGYGSFHVGGRSGVVLKAHRFAYETFVGPIPEGMHVDHLCRVRTCQNPLHLEAVTLQENTRRGLYGLLSTRCRYGHERTPENLRMQGNKQHCRICDRVSARAHYYSKVKETDDAHEDA